MLFQICASNNLFFSIKFLGQICGKLTQAAPEEETNEVFASKNIRQRQKERNGKTYFLFKGVEKIDILRKLI